MKIYDALSDLVPFAQFKKTCRKKSHRAVLLLAKLQAKSNTPPWGV